MLDLADLPAIDGHCHPLLTDPFSLDAEAFLALFSESRPGTMDRHVQHTTFFQRAMRELAAGTGGAPTLDAVLQGRRRQGAAIASAYLSRNRVEALLVDTGYPPAPHAMSLDAMRSLLPCAIHEVVRIESRAQDLLARGLGYPEFLDSFRADLREAARTAVALKSIVAYRSGLDVRPWEAAVAAQAYAGAVARAQGGGSTRLVDKPLLDTLVLIALEVCRDSGRPLQLHSGFGDPDVDLLRANPLLLRPLLEDPQWADVRIVPLHMSYPYFREAAYMASVWPQVYVDLSLALPFLGSAAAHPLVEMLALAPSTKLMYGSDLRGMPELLGLAAAWARKSLAEALDWLVERGDLSEADARRAGARILADNAAALYRLPA